MTQRLPRRKTALTRKEINEIRLELRYWYSQNIGQMLWESERPHLESLLQKLFGYHLLHIGCPLDDLLSVSRVRHCAVVDTQSYGASIAPHCYAYPDALPISSASVDVVLLPHTLEFERDPHQVLREVDRVLIAEGHVLILGFNPWSLWGIRRFFSRRSRHLSPPWCGRFLSLTRVKDWLALLGFDIVLVEPCFFRPPLNHEGIMRKLHFMETLGARWWPRLGGAYVLVAKKRVTTFTPIKPRWRPQRSLVGKLAEPAVRNAHDG